MTSGPDTRAQRLTPLLLAGLALLIGLSLWFEAGQLINHDVSTFIYNARQIVVYGKVPYVDLMDMNLPMSTWLFMPPVWAAHAMGLSSPVLVELCRAEIYLLLLAAFALSAQLLRHPLFNLGQRGWSLCLVTLAFILFPGCAGFMGQREQLILVFILPQMLLAAIAAQCAGPASRREAIVSGVFAFVAIAMKPHYMLPLLAAELLVLVKRRSVAACFRPETYTVLMLGIAYSLAIFIFFAPLLTTIPPLVQHYYWLMGHIALLNETVRIGIILFLLLLRIIYARFGRPQPFDVLLLATFGCYGAYLAQFMGIEYQHLPFEALAGLWVIAAFPRLSDIRAARTTLAMEKRGVRKPVMVSLLAALALLVSMSCLEGAWQRTGAAILTQITTYQSPEAMGHENMRRLVQRFPGVRNMYFMSGQIWPFPSVVYEDVDVSCRWGFLWMVPGELVLPPAQRGLLVTTLLEDFARYKPEIVFVDMGIIHPNLPLGFTYLQYFGQWPEFRTLWAQYELVEPDPDIPQGTFAIFRRKG